MQQLGNVEAMEQSVPAITWTAFQRVLFDFTGLGWCRSDLISFALGLLGIAWAHAFLEVETEELRLALQRTLAYIGIKVDDLDRELVKSSSYQAELEPEAIYGIVAKKPHLD